MEVGEPVWLVPDIAYPHGLPYSWSIKHVHKQKQLTKEKVAEVSAKTLAVIGSALLVNISPKLGWQGLVKQNEEV